MTPRQVLVNARRMIESRDRWCQRRMRCKREMRPGSWVMQRCMVAAIDDSAKAQFDLMVRANELVSSVVRTKHLTKWNDEHSYEQVIEALDKAIEKAAKGKPWRQLLKS